MWKQLKRFWQEPFFNKLNALSTIYYKTKGVLLYRFVFEEFGSGSCLRKPLLIHNAGFISVGRNVGIRDGVRLEVIRSKGGRLPRLLIGDNTNIEQNVHIVCHSRIRIGNNVSITGNCSIVDVTHPFENVYDPEKIGSRIKDEDSFVEIGDGSFIGIGTVILPNVKVGSYVIVGANSVVVRDIPDYSVAVGAPAIVVKRYDFAQKSWIDVHSQAPAQIS